MKTPPNEPEKRSLFRDKRGAVLAEFVVVLFPLCSVFFTMVQLSAIASARLMVKHSAVVAARAAAVYSNEHDNMPEIQGNGRDTITSAARAALGTWNKSVTVTEVSVADTSNRDANDGPYNLVTVTVHATYRCEVPMGRLICSAPLGGVAGSTTQCAGGSCTMTDTKAMPHQGVRYRKN